MRRSFHRVLGLRKALCWRTSPLAEAVAWSRLFLRRHVMADVVAGAVAGLLAGALA